MTTERDDVGRQALDQRQRYKDMSGADKALHERVLMVEIRDAGPNDTVHRCIQWRDNEERIALFRSRGYMIVQDPYIDPIISGRKTNVIPIRVPHTSISAPTANQTKAQG